MKAAGIAESLGQCRIFPRQDPLIFGGQNGTELFFRLIGSDAGTNPCRGL